MNKQTNISERIKIMYLCESLCIGGAEQLILTTFKNLDLKQFLPLVYCIKEEGKIGEEIERLGIPVIALGLRANLLNLKILYKLIGIMRDKQPQILHCHLFCANYFGRIAAILTRVPVVIITEHGTYSNFKKFYHHQVDFILSLFTNRIIAVSQAVKRYLLKHSWISFRKITIMYNAVDVDRFEPIYGLDKSLVRKKLGFPDSDLLIGCVSTLVPWKGYLPLLMAFANVIKFIPSVKLYIVGRSHNGFKQELDDFARNNGFRESIYFLGERRDIPEILKALDIFVFPSITEGLGISLLEAMYMGVPSIASNTEGIAEVIEHDKDGVLFNPGDSRALSNSILMLINEKEKAIKIGLNARKKVSERFSPNHYIDELQLLYKQMLRKKNFYRPD